LEAMTSPHRRERKKKRRDEEAGNATSGKPRSVYRYNWIHDNHGPGITARDEIIDVEESVIERNRPDIDAERSTLNIKRTYFGPQNPEPADEPSRPRKGKSVLFDKVPKWKRKKGDESGN